jgi:hypothetical protein
MKAKISSTPSTGAAIRDAGVSGRIPVGLTLLGFRDASRLAALRDKQPGGNQPGRKLKPEHIHAAFTGLFAIGTIAMLALGR